MTTLLRNFLLAAALMVTGYTTAAHAAIKVDISTYDVIFGTVQVGTTADETLVITNEAGSTGNATITISNPSTAFFAIVGGAGTFTLTPGQSRTVTIQFLPTCTCIEDAQITVTDNGDGVASNNPATVDLTGQGGAEGGGNVDTTLKLGFSNYFTTPNTIDFGTIPVGTTASVTFDIEDQSTVNTERSLTGNLSGGDAPFDITSGSGNFALTSGNGKSVTIVFAPQKVNGYLDSILITSNADDPSERHLVIYLIGKATQQQNNNDTSLVIGFNGTVPNSDTLNFGSIKLGTYGTLTFDVDDASSNSTTRSLAGSVGSATAPFNVVSGGGAFVLSSGGLTPVTIHFTPGAVGSFEDSIVITSNADNAAQKRIVLYLLGKGVDGSGGGGDTTGQISVSGLTEILNFGEINVGDIGLQYFTITNSSAENVTVTGNVTTPAAPFGIATGSGAFSLPQAGQRSVFVTFKPTKTGQFYDSIIVTSNAVPPGNRLVVYVLGTSGTSSVQTTALESGSVAAYPNPFSNANKLDLTLAQTSNVSIRVYDMLGQEIGQLANGNYSAGQHSFNWDASEFRNGTYFYRVQIGSETKIVRIVLSR